MMVLLIGPKMDGYLASDQIGGKERSAKQVEALLLKLREEILECFEKGPLVQDSVVHREVIFYAT